MGTMLKSMPCCWSGNRRCLNCYVLGPESKLKFDWQLQLYVLLIWSCPIALIGVCHLPLLVMVFLFPPLRGRFCVVNDMEQPVATSVPHLLHLSSQRVDSGAHVTSTSEYKPDKRKVGVQVPSFVQASSLNDAPEILLCTLLCHSAPAQHPLPSHILNTHKTHVKSGAMPPKPCILELCPADKLA